MAIAKIVMNGVAGRIKEYASIMETLLKQEAHVKSGALRDSISTEEKGEGTYLVGVDAEKLKSDARNAGGLDYSVPYYYGHKTYIIRAKNAKALRWVGADGKVHFAKSVRIPASAGDPFIERAMQKRPKI